MHVESCAMLAEDAAAALPPCLDILWREPLQRPGQSRPMTPQLALSRQHLIIDTCCRLIIAGQYLGARTLLYFHPFHAFPRNNRTPRPPHQPSRTTAPSPPPTLPPH